MLFFNHLNELADVDTRDRRRETLPAIIEQLSLPFSGITPESWTINVYSPQISNGIYIGHITARLWQPSIHSGVVF